MKSTKNSNNFQNFSAANMAKKLGTEQIIEHLLGKTEETKQLKKYKRLASMDSSFKREYGVALATIQTLISKRHRELKSSENSRDLFYAEQLLQHWGVYFEQ
jgi:hypothetical protein